MLYAAVAGCDNYVGTEGLDGVAQRTNWIEAVVVKNALYRPDALYRMPGTGTESRDSAPLAREGQGQPRRNRPAICIGQQYFRLHKNELEGGCGTIEYVRRGDMPPGRQSLLERRAFAVLLELNKLAAERLWPDAWTVGERCNASRTQTA